MRLIAKNITNVIGAEMNLKNDVDGEKFLMPKNWNVTTNGSHGLNVIYKFSKKKIITVRKYNLIKFTFLLIFLQNTI